MTTLPHAIDCDWHCDQYDWECTCGAPGVVSAHEPPSGHGAKTRRGADGAGSPDSGQRRVSDAPDTGRLHASGDQGRARGDDAQRTRSPLRLLDLFCCAGGAAAGYARAGFEVVGVDKDPQPRYPFAFIRSNVLELDYRFLRSFDAIHASPPCQGYSAMRHAPGAKGAPRLIGQVRDMLRASGRPYIIENVEEARAHMDRPVTLCGTMFGLGAEGAQLQRHRLFESNIAIGQPGPCLHNPARPVVGVYGGHARIRSAKHGGRTTRDAWPNGHKPVAAEAMGMEWATLAEMSEAIPPAYTEWLGGLLIAHLQRLEAA